MNVRLHVDDFIAVTHARFVGASIDHDAAP
jgi:hypothetical protein